MMPRVPRMLKAVAVSLLLAASVGLAQPEAPATEKRELVVDGITRAYRLVVPPATTADLPLLIVLHGRGGDGASMAAASGLGELAHAVIAYPDGLDGQWNYLTGLGGNSGVDDVEFLHQLVARIAADRPVDPARVYVAGYSNGGFMVQRLACEADSPFTAFASIAAAGFAGMPQLCAEQRPLSMMLVNGTSDEVVPWSGQTTLLGGRELLLSASIPQTFAFWAAYAGCGGASDRSSIPLAGLGPESVEVLLVTDCPAGADVILYAVKGGGHDWPRLEGAAGGSNGFDVSRVILEFFGVLPNGG